MFLKNKRINRARFQKYLLLLSAIASVLIPTHQALAWGWWLAAAEVVGVVVICVSTGGVGAVVLAVGAGMAVGTVGTVAKGDSVYDEIASSASNPSNPSLIYQRPNPVSNPLPPFVNEEVPPILSDGLNRAQQELADSLQFARGIRDACQRFYAARALGDFNAMMLQAHYAVEFLRMEEAVSNQAVQDFQAFSENFRSFYPPEPDLMITQEKVTQFRNDVRDSGLPSCMMNRFDQLHLTFGERQVELSFIVDKTDDDIATFFQQYPPEGVYVPDLLDETMGHWQSQPFRNAVPPEILALGQ